MRFGQYIGILVLAALPAFGQASSPQIIRTPTGRGSINFRLPISTEHAIGGVPYRTERAIVGAPYYAEEVSDFAQTLGNGTHIARTNTVRKTWRDSKGRTRIESSFGPPAGPMFVLITDVVAGQQYLLDSRNHVAYRASLTAVPPPPPGNTPPGVVGGVLGAVLISSPQSGVGGTGPSASNGSAPQFSTEDLGSKPIEGVPAQGTRHTTVYPVGSEGNDAPLKVVSEQWYSPELRLMLVSINDDPRSGLNTTKVAHLKRDEPAPDLFTVPGDYRIEDTAGNVRIDY